MSDLEIWNNVREGRVRPERLQALEDLLCVALYVAERESESCASEEGADEERAGELLAGFADEFEYLAQASPSFARLEPDGGKANNFPYGLEALVIEEDGRVDFDQNEWTQNNHTRRIAHILSDFLAPGAVVYSDAERQGQLHEGFLLRGEGDVAVLNVAWVDENNNFVCAA